MEKLETYLLAAENPIGKKQRRPLFRRKRAGEELTREQLKAIKTGRKLLRKEMKEKGLNTKEDFELMASNMGLYLDKHRALLWLKWLFHGRGLWVLMGALGMLLIALFTFSIISQMQGHFTINMSSGMFREGFVLSETADFKNASTHLFCQPAENVPCISISHLPENLDEIDGQHNDYYFAYTFYIRNEGESTVGFDWTMSINSESRDLSSACWVMIFEDSEMLFYAAPNEETGEAEALPAYGNDTEGYVGTPMMQFCKLPAIQYELLMDSYGFVYSRVIPMAFESDRVVARGSQSEVAPGESHKYTVVMWLEGDDPDCTDELIGGHAGMDFGFKLITEEDAMAGDDRAWSIDWDDLWENLIFWRD